MANKASNKFQILFNSDGVKDFSPQRELRQVIHSHGLGTVLPLPEPAA
jgi:hypothetical protein